MHCIITYLPLPFTLFTSLSCLQWKCYSKLEFRGGPSWCRRYSNLLRSKRSGDRSRWGREFSHPSGSTLSPTWPPTKWVPVFLFGGKATRAWLYPPSSSFEVKERLVYLYSPSRASWPVRGRTLHFGASSQAVWEWRRICIACTGCQIFKFCKQVVIRKRSQIFGMCLYLQQCLKLLVPEGWELVAPRTRSEWP